MSSSRRSPITEIPRGIREQEQEIESIFRNLIRCGDCVKLHRSDDRPGDKQKKPAGAWILVAVLGFISIAGFCLLWLRVAGEIPPLHGRQPAILPELSQPSQKLASPVMTKLQ